VRNRDPRRDPDTEWEDEEGEADRPRFGWRVLGRIVSHPKEGIALSIALAASAAVIVNALFLQSGPHPAPIFASGPRPVPPAKDATGTVVPVLPRPRPAELDASKTEAAAPPRPRGDIIMDIQRELARRGYYEGTADGVFGAKTDAAIREFERAEGLKAATEPSEALLRAIRSSGRASLSPGRPATAGSGAAAPRSDPVVERPAASKRVLMVQRTLTEFGYGQISPTGIEDAATASAIQKFERGHKMPVTGQISERLMREIATMAGRSVE
jgi:peptidoglycan hydrolase-like protein with peptidoglycan-binding domain